MCGRYNNGPVLAARGCKQRANYASFSWSIALFTSLFVLVRHKNKNLKIPNIKKLFQVTGQIMNILQLFPSFLVVFFFFLFLFTIPDACWIPGGKTNIWRVLWYWAFNYFFHILKLWQILVKKSLVSSLPACQSKLDTVEPCGCTDCLIRASAQPRACYACCGSEVWFQGGEGEWRAEGGGGEVVGPARHPAQHVYSSWQPTL